MSVSSTGLSPITTKAGPDRAGSPGVSGSAPTVKVRAGPDDAGVCRKYPLWVAGVFGRPRSDRWGLGTEARRGLMEAKPHPQQSDRLRALYSYDILDTDREKDFDDIVKLAAAVCGTAISVVNLIDSDRQWFKAETGLGVRETPLATSICSHIILEDEFVEIRDTLEDLRMADNPLCCGESGLRFYAGALLMTEQGLPLGTLCVLELSAPGTDRPAARYDPRPCKAGDGPARDAKSVAGLEGPAAGGRPPRQELPAVAVFVRSPAGAIHRNRRSQVRPFDCPEQDRGRRTASRAAISTPTRGRESMSANTSAISSRISSNSLHRTSP